MTIYIAIRPDDTIEHSQSWHVSRDGCTFTTTVYPILAPQELYDIDRMYAGQIVEGSIEPVGEVDQS